MLTPPDVMGAAEVRRRLGGITRPTLAVYRARPDFPPATELDAGPVWEARAIDAYARQRETGKPYLDVLSTFRRYGSGVGAIAQAAVDAHIAPSTARRYLQQLGEIER